MFQELVRKLNHWAYHDDTFIARGRQRRMLRFLDLVCPPPGARIIDLGGTEYMWKLFPHDFHVTLVNLPGSYDKVTPSDRFDYVEGDACDLKQFGDRSFDVAFSNSVIEHVGDEPRQAAFAREAQRVGRGFWIQTPSNRFPVEAHTGVPFYWALPEFARRRMLDKWQRKFPVWTDMIRNTRVLSRRRMRDLFPTAQIYTERMALLEKSNAAWRACPPR